MVNRAFFGRLSQVAIAMQRHATEERLPAVVLAALVVLLGLQPSWATPLGGVHHLGLGQG